MALKRTGFSICLSSFTTHSPGELDVFGHDGHTLGVDRAKVSVFEQANEIRLACFLQSHNSTALEPQVSFEVLSYFTYQTLERQLAQKQLSRLLVASDFSQSNCAGPVAMGFLHTSGSGCALASSLGGELFPRSLASGWFTSGLLGTSHDYNFDSQSMFPVRQCIGIYTQSRAWRQSFWLVHCTKRSTLIGYSLDAPLQLSDLHLNPKFRPSSGYFLLMHICSVHKPVEALRRAAAFHCSFIISVMPLCSWIDFNKPY